MRDEKNEKAISLNVTEGLTVTVIPNTNHEFLMSTDDVANGYGTSDYAVRKAKIRHENELIEGKHFVTAGTICPSDPHNKIYWTKRGVVRLGFFIKSKISQQFRDWAEELVIEKLQNPIYVDYSQRQLPARRNHNRLTQDRIIDILADVCRIDDRDLRLSITKKVLGGQA